MTTKYWIKLYVEILDDPKMATLPDRLWRRTIELFMCAGKLGDDGNLPDVSQLAWLMRMNSEELLLDLKQITLTGIIKQTDSGWFISKFTDRQAPVTPTRRMQEYRDRTQKHQYYDDVTNPLRDVTQTQIQNRIEAEVTDTSHPTVTNLLRNVTDHDVIRLITEASGMVAIPPKELGRTEQLYSLLETYGYDQTLTALRECYQKWINTKRKDGSGYYRPTNFGWIDQAQDVLAGYKPIEKDTAQMTDDEFKTWLRKQGETNVA